LSSATFTKIPLIQAASTDAPARPTMASGKLPQLPSNRAAQCFRRADRSTTQSNSSCIRTANSVTCDFRVTPISRPDE
jgi:hypothetical protein